MSFDTPLQVSHPGVALFDDSHSYCGFPVRPHEAGTSCRVLYHPGDILHLENPAVGIQIYVLYVFPAGCKRPEFHAVTVFPVTDGKTAEADVGR